MSVRYPRQPRHAGGPRNPLTAIAALLAALVFGLQLSILPAQTPPSTPSVVAPSTLPGPSVPPPNVTEPAKISLTQAQAELEKLEADISLEAAIKDLIRPKIKQSIEDLQKSAEYRGAAEAFRRSIDTAPTEAAQMRQEVERMPAPGDASEFEFPTTADLQRELSSRSAAKESLAAELEKVSSELVAIREVRPAAISTRTPEIEAELAKIRAELQSPDSAKEDVTPGRSADRTALLAREARLESELEMLKQERLSLTAREQLLETRAEWLTRNLANQTSVIDALKQQEQVRLESEARQAGSVVDATRQSIAPADEDAQSLVSEVEQLTALFDEVIGQQARIATAQTQASDRLKLLEEEFERLSHELEVEGAGAMIAQTAFDLQDRLLDPQALAAYKDPLLPSVESLRLSSIRVNQQLREQSSIEERFSRRNSEAIDQLIQTRAELLQKLKSQFTRLIPALITLETSHRQLQSRNQQVQEAISEELVWIRSSPAMGLSDAMRVPQGIGWWFSSQHWREFRHALEQAFLRDPIRFISILSLVVVLLTMRPRMIRSLEATGRGLRRVSTDRYLSSLEALLWTALLAAPLAVLLAFLGWAFSQEPEPSAWMRGLTEGLWSTAKVVLMLCFASELCRPQGLGDVHFNWAASTLDRIRQLLFRFGVVFVPTTLIAASTLYGDASPYSDNLGRASLIVSKIWTVYLLWRQLGGDHGLVAALKESQPHRLLTRSCWFWYPLLLITPIYFMTLAARGYVIASMELSRGVIETLGIILLGEVVYWMVLRWFSLRSRLLAINERMERLQTARDSSLSADDEAESGEAIVVTADEERLLDLETIGLQTRRLVRSLIRVTVAVAILYRWSASFPLAPTLSAVEIPFTDGIDLFELAQALLILGVTWVVVKNIQGVLELSVLRASSFDTGTRYAITTLCRYALAAIGASAIFNVLNFDWSKFGWMAAALGVGLGFGLQEVITNFVCGLILLFERPVRLGDVVTLQGVTGTVTRIRMRATTITNWDRQELIVPNKSLITDTILNWTLSASVTRIVIPVGVAYGTDTNRATQILIDIANQHPMVMQEPPPQATFDQFASSSLTLCLRCFVPDLDHRLRITSELHTEIDRRFAEAGIEIAFPQQDIHIRSGLDRLQPIKPTRTGKRKVSN